MIPKIAIVGRPNVGKSALFNRICQKRISIVDEQEGVTRDRIYAKAEAFGRTFTLIDTGGIDFAESIPFNEEIRLQAEIAIVEADAIILVVDGQVGPHPLDEEVARMLLRSQKPIILAVNKIDQFSEEPKIHAFHSLAIKDMIGVSALQGFQVAELLVKALEKVPATEEVAAEEVTFDGIRIALVGRANVGKSTLLNELLQEQRSIVSPVAGTTRDAIDVAFTHEGQNYLLIDTAGIRRKKVEKDVVDKFAAIRTEAAIERADVCLLVLDALDGFTTQEKRIASEIEALGKSCILVFNKWDTMKNFKMEHAIRGMREEIPFLNHCPTLFISALKRRNLDKIFPAIREAYAERQKRVTTGGLNRFIEGCLHKYHPPMMMGGKRLRIYYMTQVESNPPKFVLFVNNPSLMTESYRRYLINQFRESYKFTGCPLVLELRGKTPPAASEPRLL